MSDRIQIIHGISRSQPAGLRAVACALAFCLVSPAISTENQDPSLDELLAAARITESLAGDAVNPDCARGRVEGAYESILLRFPDSPRALNAYGGWLWSSGRHQEAWQLWSKAESIAPTDAETAALLANALFALGDAPAAVAKLKVAVEHAPDTAIHHFHYANAIFLFRHELGDVLEADERALFRLALDHHRIAANLEPANLEFATAYAQTFYGLPDPPWEEALDAWKQVRARSTDPTHADIHIARIQLRMGNSRAAMATLDSIPAESRHIIPASLKNEICKAASNPDAPPEAR